MEKNPRLRQIRIGNLARFLDALEDVAAVTAPSKAHMEGISWALDAIRKHYGLLQEEDEQAAAREVS